jgi:phosphatidylglycerol:prolipoprotein diacylglycerol transferase
MHISCSYKLTTIYGPFAINIYGLFIALALIVCMKLITFNKRFAHIGLDKNFIDIIFISVIAGIIGGRFLEVISTPQLYSHWTDWFALWQGGLSALGSILGVVIITPLYLKKMRLPVLSIFDLVAIYAPLFQSIARMGCLFAGCCYGISTHFFLHIVYTHKETIAPYNISLHPTQLYSSLLLFIIFLYLFFIAQYQKKPSGHIFLTYLILVSMERFIVDFWRADRILIFNSFLSFHQLIAIIIICGSIIMKFIQKHRNLK